MVLPDQKDVTYPGLLDGVVHLNLLDAEIERWWSAADDSLSSICNYALRPPGKLFRSLLLLESGLAVGGPVRQLLPAAVGTEFGHVASLIHDDIIDQDEMRRGRLSVQARYGRDDAIISGDALFFALFKCLADCHTNGASADRVVRALDIVSSVGLDLCRGQMLEAQVTGELDSGAAMYFQVIEMKTASLFRGSCMCGAVLGDGTEPEVAALGRYGEALGIAFQIQDDLLPYTSDGSVTGKPAVSDVRNKRVTLPVILAHQSASPPARKCIGDVFSKQQPDADDFGRLGEIVRATGAVDEVLRVARHHIAEASGALAILADTPSRARLERFTELILARRA